MAFIASMFCIITNDGEGRPSREMRTKLGDLSNESHFADSQGGFTFTEIEL